MTLEKLIHMLHSSGLFFSRPTALGDPFEGSLPAATINRLQNVELARLVERNTTVEHTVSCWHEMEYESAAMWRLYAGRGAGIAVKTDFESLMESLSPNWITNFPPSNLDDPYPAFIAGRVSYVDYDMDDIPVLNGMPLFYKRKSFSYESEVRVACYEDESESRYGTTWHVDLERLIHEIVVSPLAKDWEFAVVVETTRRFSASFAEKVRLSDIAKPTNLTSVYEEMEGPTLA